MCRVEVALNSVPLPAPLNFFGFYLFNWGALCERPFKEKALSGGNYIMRDSLYDARAILNQKEIHIISGARRCGKSTLIRLLMGKTG